MKIIFTCGGTAGHIYPAVSVANLVRTRHPTAEILFVGADGGMETRLIPREGFRLQTVTARRMRHSLSPKALVYNVKTLATLRRSQKQANKILDGFDPNVVVATGGFACFAITSAAQKRKIPTIVHESNALPGWTTRMLAEGASDMLVSFEESRKFYKRGVSVVGTPVREAFFAQKNRTAPRVVSFWGSLGASRMNEITREMFKLETEQNTAFEHIAACGKAYYAEMKDENLPERIKLSEFIYDMPETMAGASLVICRAGSSTLAEVCAAGVPSILIPSPNVTHNHQDRNADVLVRAGAAVKIPESECSAQKLLDCVTKLLSDGEKLAKMSAAARNLSVPDSAERLYKTVLSRI